MAVSTVLFSIPLALMGAAWAQVLHGLSALETLGVYSALGTMTLLTVFIALSLASLRRF